MEMFNEIKSRNDLADYLKIPRSILTYVLYVKKVESYYTVFEIPKKNGGNRKIAAPSGDLKDIQTKLSVALWNYQCEFRCNNGIQTNISHAFEKEKGIITNAKVHRNKKYVLNIDLKDYFDSFHFGRVAGFFEKNKNYMLPHEVAVVIAQLVCYKGKLPQGAPSSPIITNLICQILDMRILKLAKAYRLDYTRYADDLTFSTNCKDFDHTQTRFLSELSSIIANGGFSINTKKTRLIYKDSRQEVTGLVVNKKVNINRGYVKETKAMAHSLYTNGSFTIDGIEGTIDQLEGRFSFIDQLSHFNNRLDGTKHDCYKLCRRERDYRAFIFYKQFFAAQKPLIITEGKTDIRYLRAALKNQFEKYPDLIVRNDDGSFDFKISFFHRSKRWRYFFGIGLDGGDAIKNLYRYFTDNNCENLYKYFSKKYGCIQNAPTIFLFDNETESKKPLNNFWTENSKTLPKDKKVLQNTLFLQLQKDSKLYLLTNPLVDNLQESEIEDLFSSKLLSLKLGGKQFCKDDKFDSTLFYGKDIFSNYVMSHYKSIDFSGFIPLLDALNTIVTLH